MNIIELLEALKEPTSSLTIGERLFAGVSVAALSMAVVVIVLVIIALIINVLQYERPAKISVVTESVEPIVSTEEAIEIEETDDKELVAIITAAIVAASGKSNIVVTKIRRTNNVIGSWESLSKNAIK